MEDIKRKILDRRLTRMQTEGPEMGHPVPAQRQSPLVPFDRDPWVICEVKRRSPSRGVLSGNLDPVAQARRYVEAGVKTISVLTEEDHFGGSLADLMAVKQAFPQTAVLRKDFLATPQDIEVAFRAGADAVLLIASLLDLETLRTLKNQAETLGMAVFVEVHDAADVEKTRGLKPEFTGINCRNLGNFTLDRLIPLQVKPLIDWPTRLVFESGIFRVKEADFAAQAGFQGILVGESVVKNPALAQDLVKNFKPPFPRHPAPRGTFWSRLWEHKHPRRPLVKICGLTRKEDAALADDLGSDLLGFVLAPSPRQTTPEFIKTLGPTRAQKVGVVVLGRGEMVPKEIEALIQEGHLDALQFHGQEDPSLVDAWGQRGYKALGPQSPQDLEPYQGLLAPRILVDARGADGRSGGTGTLLDPGLLEKLPREGLWLAGGLRSDNIKQVADTWNPELVDASSGLEASPGVKDPVKVRKFFEELDRGNL